MIKPSLSEEARGVIHVSISEPTERRKVLLEVALEAIQVLKRFERLKKLRREQELYRKGFLKTMREISAETKEMEEMLPQIRLHEEKPPDAAPASPKAPPTPTVVKRAPPPKPRKFTEVDKLEDDIKRIKEKLASL